jgi:hypothetical protein
MENYISSLKNKVFQDIQKIERMECDMLQKSKLIIPRLENSFEELKSFISNYSFKDTAEEVHFFKEVKPRLFCQLVYYNKVYNIEMRMPAGSVEDIKVYLERIQNQIRDFCEMNLDFYGYYRSGNTHLDHLYFLRGKPEVQLQYDSYYFERDYNFSTCYDFKMTKILANEMITIYLNNKLAKITERNAKTEPAQDLHLEAKWTEKKIALGEIVYGIDTLASVCFGNIDIKVLAEKFGDMFNVDMSNIFQIYSDIRKRKINRTEYLSRMIEALKRRMDEDDSK